MTATAQLHHRLRIQKAAQASALRQAMRAMIVILISSLSIDVAVSLIMANYISTDHDNACVVAGDDTHVLLQLLVTMLAMLTMMMMVALQGCQSIRSFFGASSQKSTSAPRAKKRRSQGQKRGQGPREQNCAPQDSEQSCAPQEGTCQPKRSAPAAASATSLRGPAQPRRCGLGCRCARRVGRLGCAR